MVAVCCRVDMKLDIRAKFQSLGELHAPVRFHQVGVITVLIVTRHTGTNGDTDLIPVKTKRLGEDDTTA